MIFGAKLSSYCRIGGDQPGASTFDVSSLKARCTFFTREIACTKLKS